MSGCAPVLMDISSRSALVYVFSRRGAAPTTRRMRVAPTAAQARMTSDRLATAASCGESPTENQGNSYSAEANGRVWVKGPSRERGRSRSLEVTRSPRP